MSELYSLYTVQGGSDTRRLTAQGDLIDEVSRALRDGWLPLGGIAYLGTETVNGFTCHVFCQAMVKPRRPVDTDHA